MTKMSEIGNISYEDVESLVIEDERENIQFSLKCENCRHWKGDELRMIGLHGEIGECRRHPPTYRAYDKSLGFDSGRWPLTSNYEWCGEIKPVFGECDDEALKLAVEREVKKRAKK